MKLLQPILVLFTGLSVVAPFTHAATAPAPFRPPSVPLVAVDPYFSIWSPADRLTDEETRHWTGRPHPLHSMIRIDGRVYRLMGREPSRIPALPQTSIQVLPTRTTYTFRNNAVQATLSFMTPALPQNLDTFSRPVTYLTWRVRSLDGKPHRVALYYDNEADLVVNTPDQPVTWRRENLNGISALRMGSVEQPILAKRGDDLRIDWGYLYAAAPATTPVQSTVARRNDLIEAFSNGRPFPAIVTMKPAPAARAAPVMAFQWSLGNVGKQAVTRNLLLAYDDLYSIEYFRTRLRPYWRRNGEDAAGLIRRSLREQPALFRQSEAFDLSLLSDLRLAGGEKYARISALAYRQTTASGKLAADAKGGPLFFNKENFSNGCIATVDVTYPMAPQFLFTSLALMKASIVSVLDYAASPRWKFPFAPHDLGTYPKANGQVYGGGERTLDNQMPVEESGNMLILLAAIAKAEGNPRFSVKYWPQIKKWAEYLKAKGLDPENQLSTDDFAGHLAHNVNLSAKAILALRSYALLCEMRGLRQEAQQYRLLTADYARAWAQRADDGDHYRLAFDRPGTWSQKYNLVWDEILGFKLFPESVRRTELAFYKKMQNRYGLPLDNRRDYTKLDWVLWTATLGTESDFHALVNPVYDFLNATPDRVPMTDWYETKNAEHVGFQARPVVGGVYLKMLYDPATWRKWTGRGTNVSLTAWAPLPVPPVVREIVPTSQRRGIVWRYTFRRPDPTWFRPGFDASGWEEGPGGFGTRGTPSSEVRTEWRGRDIWMRREFTLPNPVPRNLQLYIHHDEDATVYLNGVPAATLSGFSTDYDTAAIQPAARAALKPGRNVIAIHCRQTGGGQYIDAGFVQIVPTGNQRSGSAVRRRPTRR